MESKNNVIPIVPNTITTSRRSSRTYNSPADEHRPGTSRIFYLLTVEQFPKSTNNDSESIGPHTETTKTDWMRVKRFRKSIQYFFTSRFANITGTTSFTSAATAYDRGTI